MDALAAALCHEYHPMHWDVAYGNRNKPCEACKIHAASLVASGWRVIPPAESGAPDEGCACAEIAEVVGSRLTDRSIIALCDRLRPRALPPDETLGLDPESRHR